MRFLINTTVGAAGLFDVASGWGYPAHDADFGITLALWGWGEGPFLFLPVLGPSNPRDATGFAGDIVLDPLTWASFGGSKTLSWSRYGVGAVDARERVLDPVDQIKKTALDPYATFRSLYRQHRRSQIEETRDDDAATVPAWFVHH
jgi:phospholipid-binding lipoprotein MlaA